MSNILSGLVSDLSLYLIIAVYVVVVYHITIVAIGHGLLKKLWPLVLGCVLRTAGSSIIWNYANPLNSSIHYSGWGIRTASSRLTPSTAPLLPVIRVPVYQRTTSRRSNPPGPLHPNRILSRNIVSIHFQVNYFSFYIYSGYLST